MRRTSFTKTLILVGVVLFGFYTLKKIESLPSFKNLFASKPLVIDETPILIKDIKSIGQLITAAATDEVVVTSTLPTRGSGFVNSVNRLSPIKLLPSADKRIVLIGKGKVLAGTDFTKLDSNAIKISGDTVTIRLPQATIIDAILNPADFETFEETGLWTPEEVITVKLTARQKMINRALQNNLLTTADNKAKAIVSQLLSAAGFKVVNVSINAPGS